MIPAYCFHILDYMHELISSGLGAFLGALFGIPSGFLLNHYWSVYTDRARKDQLKGAIRSSLGHNRALVENISEWLSKEGVPYFNLDLTLIDSTAALKYELLEIPLCMKIDLLQFEMAHFARKLDVLLSLRYNATAHMQTTSTEGSFYRSATPVLYESLKSHIPVLVEMIDGIDKELQ